jgi:two-component system chemotaxis response regulator CheY
MTAVDFTVLVAEPDARLRALLVSHLTPLGCTVLQAEDGPSAFRMLNAQPVSVVLAELYLKTEAHADLIQAIRSTKALRHTRAVAHTRRATTRDRDWATNAGADAFLIYPTRAERLRYVVGRLASEKGSRAASATKSLPVLRRSSLDKALVEQERGGPAGMSTIVVGKEWWAQLTPSKQASYRKRAKTAGVVLRADALLGTDYVVVRNPSRAELAALTRPASPYKERTAQQ